MPIYSSILSVSNNISSLSLNHFTALSVFACSHRLHVRGHAIRSFRGYAHSSLLSLLIGKHYNKIIADLVSLGHLSLRSEYLFKRKCRIYDVNLVGIDLSRLFRCSPTNIAKRQLSLCSVQWGLANDVLDTLSPEARESGLAALTRIDEGNGYFCRDKATKRLHTAYCQLPSSLRRCITINGDFMVGVDVSCMQPACVAKLIGSKALADDVADGSLYSKLLDIVNSNGRGKHYKRNKLIAESLLKHGITPDLKQVKIDLLKLLNANHKNGVWLPSRQHDKRHYLYLALMSVYGWSFIQKLGNYNLKHGGRKSALALDFMKIESRIMVSIVSPILDKKGIAHLTVHDSIHVHAEHAEETAAIIEAQFLKINMRINTHFE